MKAQVLIVGAGPTGLMMACQLQRWGIDFVIIDDKDTITGNSKALAVQARSIEIFRQMGIADKAVAHGAQAKALNLVVKNSVRGHIAFGNMGEGLSPYPYILMLEQSKNEALLNEYLNAHGRQVLWKHSLVSFVNDEGGIIATVKDSDGRNTDIQAHYIVGADGSKSAVRQLLGTPFEGGTYEHVFFVMDTKVTWKLPPDELYIIFSRETFSAFFPMKGDSRFRMVGTMPKKFKEDGSVTFDDIENTVKRQMDIPIAFSGKNWFSIYRVHHKVADSFRAGSAFLAGDAAHVHSPVGAQGMNTGLQDAYNLAWKMAWALKGTANEKLLDTYHEERHLIAKILVESTDRLFGVVNDPGIWARIFKFYLLPLFAPVLMHINGFKRKVFKLASQIAVKYPYSSLSVGEAGKIKAGTRFPYFKWMSEDGACHDSFDFFSDTGLYVITSGIGKVDLPQLEGVAFYLYDIPRNNANIDILGKLGFSNSFICIVRPDTYIGYLCNRYNVQEIKEYLQKNLFINLSE